MFFLYHEWYSLTKVIDLYLEANSLFNFSYHCRRSINILNFKLFNFVKNVYGNFFIYFVFNLV